MLHLFACISSDILQCAMMYIMAQSLLCMSHCCQLPAAKQVIVASKTPNISLICHQCTDETEVSGNCPAHMENQRAKLLNI